MDTASASRKYDDGPEPAPRPGDYSLCLACGAVGVFTKDFHVRKPTLDEHIAIEANPDVINAQFARAIIVGDKIKNRK